MIIALAFGTPAEKRDGRSSLQTERAENTDSHVDTVTVDRKQIIVKY